jgi:multidrug efflux pump subunit AcrA (membrane-fusion protein)
MAQKKLDMFKMEKDGKETQELLQKHVKDRELITITAPADGYVYYGEIINGTMANASTYAKLLVRDGTPPLKKTVLTICNNNELLIHLDVEEGDINAVKEMQSASIVPKVDNTRKLLGKVHAVKRVPDVNNKFEVRLKLDNMQDVAHIYPAMTCQCTILQAEQKDVLALPEKAIFEAEDKTNYVYLKTMGKFEKKTVKKGETINKMTVITEGLKEGDEISPVDPEAK